MVKALRIKTLLYLSFLLIAMCHNTCAIAQRPYLGYGPGNSITCPGSKAYFRVDTSPDATSWYWLCSTDAGAHWDTVRNSAIYEDAGTPTLVVHTEVSMNGYQYRMVAWNINGFSNSSPTATLTLSNNIPDLPYAYFNPTTICQGSSPLVSGFALSDRADTILYSYSGSGATIDADSLDFHDYTIHFDSIANVHFDATATSGTLSIAGRNACGTGPVKTIPFTLTAPSSTLAGISNSSVCASYTVPAGGSIFYDPSGCKPINSLLPSGASPVSGDIKSCVTFDDPIQSYNGVPYVQRHYDIEPSINAGTSTATLTLYYAQSDFDSYNLARGANPALPTGPSDAAGIANLRITQFHGTGSAPGSYAGGSGEIDPDDSKIVWNTSANRWEVTFDITGFSGFYASGGSLVPLPLTLTNFSARATANGNLLQWTTSSEQNTAAFEVQRSDKAGDFRTLTSIPAAGNSTATLQYNYTDATATSAGISYAYRLRMTDLDGAARFSNIVLLEPDAASGLIITLTPNPFHNPLSIIATAAAPCSALMKLTNLDGKTIEQQKISLTTGNNTLHLRQTGNLPAGVYILTLTSGGQQKTARLVKY